MIAITVSLEIEAPLLRVFDAARGFNVAEIIKPRGVLPGVQKVDQHVGAWTAPGQKRLLTLSDGSSLVEELTAFTPNANFTYRVSSFTGPFAALVNEGRGEWNFTTTGPSRTLIDWTYSLTPKSFLAGPVVLFVVKMLWPGYARAALERLKVQIEGMRRAA